MVGHLARRAVAPRVGGAAAWAVAAARVAAGAVFVAFSIGKFVRHGAESASIERYGFPFPDLTTYAVGSLELVGGLLLIVGLATRLAALALAADMVGAISTAGRVEGGPVNLGLAPVLLVVMLGLVWTGGGRLSLDGRLARTRGGGGGPANVPLGLVALGLACALSFSVAAPASASGPSLSVRGSAYGRVLFDGGGRALYVFTRDRAGRSTCSGACARAWPPYLVGSRPTAGRGVRGGLVGTVQRADGRRQATYAGRPLYYYVGDDGPGVIRCQNVTEFGGVWLVQRPTGQPVR
jgi:predicted lipoprotein with Yx(FWY)xxD motif/uncharacterized membrane protein YphA (DoxX/SURF4 family)